jgi:hypothetical protein
VIIKKAVINKNLRRLIAHLSHALKIQGCCGSRLNLNSGCLHFYKREVRSRPIKRNQGFFGFIEAWNDPGAILWTALFQAGVSVEEKLSSADSEGVYNRRTQG